MEVSVTQIRRDVEELYLSPPPVPSYMSGRSIVTSIHHGELASGYVLLKELARLNITLPIEVFYRKGELTDSEVNILKAIYPENISVKEIKGNAKDFITPYNTKAGWSVKVYALFESEYNENLWLDSDNFPIRNPEFLFDDPEYKTKHCLFWRDVFSTDRADRYFEESTLWIVFNVLPNDAEPFEAGQLLINKKLSWPQFCLVKYYADNCEIYYNFGGDTETFRMAWQHHSLRSRGYHTRVNYHESPHVPYGFMPYGPFHKGQVNTFKKWGGGTVMVQRDRNGDELFNHRNLQKFCIDPSKNTFNKDIQNEQIYHDHILELQKLLGKENG